MIQAKPACDHFHGQEVILDLSTTLCMDTINQISKCQFFSHSILTLGQKPPNHQVIFL